MKTVGELNGWTWEELEPIARHHLGTSGLCCAFSGLQFVRQGNFTVCEVCFSPDLRAFGVAKRHPKLDPRNKPAVARKASFGRACAALARELRRQPLSLNQQRAADMQATMSANRRDADNAVAAILEREDGP